MSERNTVLRSMHDIGLAGWFGGSLMGAVGLNGAAAQAANPAERLQIGLARDPGHITRLSAGVASYPTHAMQADEILRQAHAALARACAAEPDHGLGPVEVAKAEM